MTKNVQVYHQKVSKNINNKNLQHDCVVSVTRFLIGGYRFEWRDSDSNALKQYLRIQSNHTIQLFPYDYDNAMTLLWKEIESAFLANIIVSQYLALDVRAFSDSFKYEKHSEIRDKCKTNYHNEIGVMLNVAEINRNKIHRSLKNLNPQRKKPNFVRRAWNAECSLTVEEATKKLLDANHQLKMLKSLNVQKEIIERALVDLSQIPDKECFIINFAVEDPSNSRSTIDDNFHCDIHKPKDEFRLDRKVSALTYAYIHVLKSHGLKS